MVGCYCSRYSIKALLIAASASKFYYFVSLFYGFLKSLFYLHPLARSVLMRLGGYDLSLYRLGNWQL